MVVVVELNSGHPTEQLTNLDSRMHALPLTTRNKLDQSCTVSAERVVEVKDVLEQSHEEERDIFADILACYPVVIELVSHLDLNTIHSLSRTSHTIRNSLLQHRKQIQARTLRCANDDNSLPAPYPYTSIRAANAAATATAVAAASTTPTLNDAEHISRIWTPTPSGRSLGRRCARDMVGQCRRCGVVVCRNCTIKAPAASNLRNRHRRLCAVCLRAPLSALTARIDPLLPSIETTITTYTPEPNASGLRFQISPTSPIPSPQPSTFTNPPSSPAPPPPATPPSTSSTPHPDFTAPASTFTTPAFLRTPCTCADEIFLCRSCGITLSSADLNYRRIWTWRTRYSTGLGFGLGTGIGEGSEGVKCGRGYACLGAQDIVVEIDGEGEAEGKRALITPWWDPSSREEEDLVVEVVEAQGQGHVEGTTNHHNNVFASSGGGGLGGNANDIISMLANGATNAAVSQQLSSNDIPPPSDSPTENRHHGDAGYFRQEVEGLGGVMKKKVKKRIRVGRTVREFEDERERGAWLEREAKGEMRSWCGWCDRVVPAKEEKQ